jgi:hypothetical protein
LKSSPDVGGNAMRTRRPSARKRSAAAFAARWPTPLASLSAQITTIFAEGGSTRLLIPPDDSAAHPGKAQACKRWWVRLHEKGGKRHEMPAHHKLEGFLDEYIRAAGFGDEAKSPLFRSARGRTGELNGEAMHRIDAYRMITEDRAVQGRSVELEEADVWGLVAPKGGRAMERTESQGSPELTGKLAAKAPKAPPLSATCPSRKSRRRGGHLMATRTNS